MRCFNVEPLPFSTSMPVVPANAPAKVRLDAVLACPFPVTVEVEVLDPSSQVLAASVQLDQQPSRIAADVTFAPTRPGRHLVIGRFQPSMEVVQLLVEVTKARPTPEEPRLVDAMPFNPELCTSLARTREGSVICTQSASTVVVHDGGISDQLSPGAAFISGNTVWLVRVGQVDRYVDDAGTLVPMGRAVPLQSFAARGFFGEDLAILVDGASPRGPFTWDGGQLLVDEGRPFPPGSRVVFGLGTRSFALNGEALCEVKNGPRACVVVTDVVGATKDIVWTTGFIEAPLEVRGADVVTPQLTRSFRSLTARPLPGDGRLPAISAASAPTLIPDDPRQAFALLAPRVVKNEFVLEAWPLTTQQLGNDFVLLERSPNSLTWVAR